MLNDWNPAPKPNFQKKEKKLQPYMKKRPKKKKRPRNPLKKEIYKGRTIPTKQKRGKITTAEYNETLRLHGEECFFCKTTQNLECHHVMPKGYSRYRNGRGVRYNLRFLCSDCHRGPDGVHQNRGKMQELQDLHESLYGKWFYCDEFDLFKMGLIPNTDKDTYHKFMQEAKGSGETWGDT